MGAQHYLAQHCGVNVAMKLEGEPTNGAFPDSVPTKCLICGDSLSATQISAWAYERHNAIDDECKNCGQAIVFLADHLEWVHAEDDVEVTDPGYGIRSCQNAMEKLLGMPAPAYGDKRAEPADTHTTVDLQTGVETKASEKAYQQVVGDKTKYNPRVASKPGEPLEIEVDLPDNATDEEHFEAMEEAIEKIMPGFMRTLGGK